MSYNKLLTLGGPCLTESSPSNYRENQWTGFYIIGYKYSFASKKKLF